MPGDERAIRTILDAVYQRHGYDFRGYAPSTVERRLGQLAIKIGKRSISDLEDWLHAAPEALAAIVDALTIQVTEMFRDPSVFATFRREVVPFIRTYPTLKLWVAGCSSGEEAHSVAILLREEGLLARSIIYATDVSAVAVGRARAGVYAAERLAAYAANHERSGGRGALLDYFHVAHGHAAIDPTLAAKVHFAEHNLVSDEVFGEMHVIFCRNVLIYFDRALQRACTALLARSLIHGGFLCLGSKESLLGSGQSADFDEVVAGSRIFRKRIGALER